MIGVSKGYEKVINKLSLIEVLNKLSIKLLVDETLAISHRATNLTIKMAPIGAILYLSIPEIG